MLCKLLTCRSEAVERRTVPFGTVNMCEIHAQEFDWWSEGDFRRDDILRELMFACRFGPSEDPPLSLSMRGRDYETGYKTGTE